VEGLNLKITFDENKLEGEKKNTQKKKSPMKCKQINFRSASVIGSFGACFGEIG